MDRALDLFEHLVTGKGELGLRELSEISGLPVGTVHRLVAALARRGYVRQNPATRRYTVGPAALALAERLRTADDLPNRAQPFLCRLVQLTGESANLAALDGTQAVYLAHVAPSRTVRMFTAVGNRAPLYATGTGKVLLANLDAARLDALLDHLDLRAYTATTITDRERLLEELRTIRAQGFAHDDGELEDGVRCIAVPVRDRTQQVVAALSISGPNGRLTRERADAWLLPVQEAAQELSLSLGADAGPAPQPVPRHTTDAAHS